MPISEYREIRFDAAALRAALQARLVDVNARARQGQDMPPAGTVLAASVAQADPLLLTVALGSPDGAQRGSLTMEAVEVAAALIRACMRQGIRLPRSGTKAVRAIQGGVALVVTIAHAHAGDRTTAPDRSRAA